MLYAISDIHGCVDALRTRLRQIAFDKDDRLVLLGDYIDYGPKSGEVLHTIFRLQEEKGQDKVIVLKGNHEDMFLNWMKEHVKQRMTTQPVPGSWLVQDSDMGFRTLKTLISPEGYEEFVQMARKASYGEISDAAACLVMDQNGSLIKWLKQLPLYYETETQIFVHAGVDEEADDLWKVGTADETFMWKYPAKKGSFYKTIIAGHVGTHTLADDKDYHDIYYDGESHYYVDGTVYSGGTLCLLAYDDSNQKYYSVNAYGELIPITGGRLQPS